MRREFARMRCAAVVLTLLACVPRAAFAAWSYDPGLNTPVCTAIADQTYPVATTDGAGGYIVAWVDYRLSGYGDVYAQRLDAHGEPLWAENGVAVCSAAYAQNQVCIAPDGAGGAYIAWADGRGAFTGIYAQHLDASGHPQWSIDGEEISVGLTGRPQVDPAIAGDGAGHAMLSYTDQKAGGNDEIWNACFSGNTIPWRSNRVSWASGPQNGSRIVADGFGGCIISWDDRRSGGYTDNYDIFAQRVLFSGAVLWATDGVAVCDARFQQSGSRLCADGTGGAIVSWIDKQDGDGSFHVYANRLDSNGSRSWGPVGIPIANVTYVQQYYQHIVPDGAGGAILAWQDDRNVANTPDIYAQRVNGAGQSQWTANGVPLCTATGDQLLSITQAVSLASDGAGGAIAVWEDKRGGASDVYAQRVGPNGQVLWAADGIPVSNAPQSQRAPAAITDGSGGAVAVWFDERSGRDIYAARVPSSGAPFAIVATAGAHGQIQPSGTVYVPAGEAQTFTLLPDADYMVQDVVVDGVSAGAVPAYTFTDVAANHTIAATFTLAPRNVIAGAAPNACVTPGNACLTVPVGITRIASTTGVRGFSVDVRLSANLQLCAGTSSVTEGTYLSDVGSTMFHVLDRGGGLYTVDGLILGLPCGATAPSGTLFQMQVTHGGIGGTGFVSMAGTVLRDCDNLDVVASAGAPAAVTIDLAPLVVDAIADQTVVEDTQLIVTPLATLDACARAPVTWSGSGLPAGATVHPASGSFAWTPPCSAYESGPVYGPVTLTATDALGNTAHASFGITVSDNPGTATVAPIAAQTIAETATLTVHASATPNGCAVPPFTWTAAGLPVGATLDAATGDVSWTPDCRAFENGPLYGPIVLTAHAATGGTGNASFTIAVTNTPGSVVLDPISLQTIGETFELRVQPTARIEGCAEAPLTWSGTDLPSGATVDPLTGLFAWTPDCRAADITPRHGPFVLVARAAGGEVGTASFDVDVLNMPGRVIPDAIPPQIAAEGTEFVFTPAAHTEGCAEQPVHWSATNLPPGALFDPADGRVAWTPGCRAAQDGPVYGPIGLMATALTGEMGYIEYTITVTDVPTFASPVTELAASANRAGNDTDGTTAITVTFTAPPYSTVEVYRAPFGNYPEYDDAPGSGAAPAAPGYPPPPPWTLTAITASGETDDPGPRDCWFYAAFARNDCGDVSAVSTLSAGTLDYSLGDFTDGATPGQGDNAVTTADVSLLGAHYGAVLGPLDALGYLDIGPTLDRSVRTMPVTDNMLQFEDAILCAINYGQVASPVFGGQIAAILSNALTAEVPLLPAVGETFTVTLRLSAAGDLQGLSAQLAFDAGIVEQLSVESGTLLAQQDLPSMALSSAPGNVDVVLFGSGAALRGEGALATVTFRVKAAGDPAFRLLAADGRDAENRAVTIATATEIATPPVHIPDATYLGGMAPNPVRGSATLAYGLHEAGRVRLRLYDVGGRLVRTLLDERQDAGDKALVWNGDDRTGRRVGAGLYVLRLEVEGTAYSRTVQVLR